MGAWNAKRKASIGFSILLASVVAVVFLLETHITELPVSAAVHEPSTVTSSINSFSHSHDRGLVAFSEERASTETLAASCEIIGPGGGTVVGDGGEVITIPPDAVETAINVCVTTSTASMLTEQIGTLPSGTRFLGGISLTLDGATLSQPATLRIPNDAAAAVEDQIVVAKTIDPGELGAAGLEMLAKAHVSGDESEIVSDPSEIFPGIREDGLLIFELVEAPLGYVYGTTFDVSDSPVGSALVFIVNADGGGRPDTSVANYIDLTDGNGNYYLPIESESTLSAPRAVSAESYYVMGLYESESFSRRIEDSIIIGGLSSAIQDIGVDIIKREFKLDDPDVSRTVSHELLIDCPSSVLYVGSGMTCEALYRECEEFSIQGVPSGGFCEPWKPVKAGFVSSDPSVAFFIGPSLIARRSGAIVATAEFNGLYDSTSILVVCPPGEIECEGSCYPGNCCDDSDCPEEKKCVNHTCQGWESKPLSTYPSVFLKPQLGGVELLTIGADTALPRTLSSSPSLTDLLPSQALAGTHIITATLTRNFASLTNAVEAYSVDFVDDQTSEIRAEAFVLKTMEGPYDHDYSVCERFHGFTLDQVYHQQYATLDPTLPWFWHCTLYKNSVVENALVFSVLVDEDSTPPHFSVDSRWLEDYYPDSIAPPYDYMINYQIWSRSSAEEASEIMQQAVEKLSQAGTVSYVNTIEPIAPSLFIRTASYSDETVHLTVQSALPEPQSVHFFGATRYFTDTNTMYPVDFSISVAPGTSIVDLPVGNIIDGVIYSEVEGFMDKVYVGGGFWFHFSDDGSAVTSEPIICETPTNLASSDFPLGGCYQISGTLAPQDGHIGIGRVFNPNGLPVDLGGYDAIAFWAKGDGRPYRILIETDSVDDYDYPQYIITPPENEWKQFVIPFALFKQQGWGLPVPFTASDVIAIVWSTVAPYCETAVGFSVDRVAFTNSTIITDTDGPASTNNAIEPYVITSSISDDWGITSATLSYSSDGGGFQAVPMAGADDVFSGLISAQPIGTELRYFIEAQDAHGNTATGPVDAPVRTYLFKVEWFPSLLIDDFDHRSPINYLGGSSATFSDPDGGGIVSACYDDGFLELYYDVTDHVPGVDEYAGFVTPLGGADLTLFNSLAFDVRGIGEARVRVGLKDEIGNEPKIEMREYMLDGVTTDWQEVRIPLSAFAQVDNWSQIDSLSFVAEEQIQSGTATIFVDDIRLEPMDAPITIDSFNDMTTFNGLGGHHSTFTGGAATIDCSFDSLVPAGGIGASLKIDYSSIDSSSYGVWQTALENLDATMYPRLELVVKGQIGGEKFHLYLEGSDGTRAYVDITDYATIDTEWQPVEIPLTEFSSQGLDLASLAHLQVAFEWEDMDGTVFLDDISFPLPSPPSITSAVPSDALSIQPTQVTILGSNFATNPIVAMGSYLLEDVALVDPTTLYATVPSGMPPGVYDLHVIQSNMQTATLQKGLSIWGSGYLPLIMRGFD